MIPLGAALLLLAGTSSHGRQDFDAAMARAVALYNEAEWDAALRELSSAEKLAKDDAQRVSVWLHQGVMHANVPNPDLARAAWKRALELDANAALPLAVSPRVRTLFEEVQKQVRAAAPKDAPRASPLDPGGEPGSRQSLPQSLDESHVPIVPIVSLGLGVVCAGVGLGFALDANNQLAASRNTMDPLAHDALRARASTEQLVANIAFAVAGAAALTALITFIVLD